MKRHFLAACALAFLSAWLAAPAQAQVVVGGTGGATFVIADGEMISVGSVLGEIEWQTVNDSGDLRGGLLAYTGLNSEGGGEQVGGGYRWYFRRPGGSYVFGGVGGFVLGSDTPSIEELTGFLGLEVGLQIPAGGDDSNRVTGFAGIYPAVIGSTETGVVRLGVRAALN